ncbi:heavy metal translocating P-type ATPase [Coraliomargarita parva]|uniref:heavy metal translocating P-type ATPase n=1 Tax=Coraliomargarita parva TaxID=3014050 RepID=UPI0022B5324E|nr:heavy metal translocating P-type ATPase [Coraliomargarita parva]
MGASQQSPTESRAVVCTTGEQSCDALDEQLARSWLRVAVAAVFAGQGMVFSLAVNMTPPDYGSVAYWVLHGGLLFSALIVLTFLGGPLLQSTWGMLRARRLSIEGLFTLSLVGALGGSIVSTVTGQGGIFYEVVSIVIAIYTIGRMLGERSQSQLLLQSEQLRERFDQADLVDSGGVVTRMPVSELLPGNRVQVAPGQPFTVDGVILSGSGYVRETALSGEPVPVVRHPGDRVRAGTWSEDGLFVVKAEAVAGQRELDRILETVESTGGRPSELQEQANQLIQSFLPLVAGVSLVTAVYWSFMGSWTDAVLNSMAVLLVACPCALGLATPVAIWQGLFRLSRMGLVSRDGALLDALARTRKLFFDKTGTLSESALQVTELLVLDAWRAQRSELLAAVSVIERHLNHPVAQALVRASEGAPPAVQVHALRILAGEGVSAEVESAAGGHWQLKIGEASLGADREALAAGERQLREQGGKRVYVFEQGVPAAIFVLKEQAREGLDAVWRELGKLGVDAAVLTGDPRPELSLPEELEVAAGLSAADKETRVQAAGEAGLCPILVGDGLNDASAMSCAAASVAMGSGVPMTRTVATGQLVNDRLSVLPEAITLARRIRRRLKGNLIYAAAYNSLGMLLAACGWLHPVFAALIMLISSFWVTARALGAVKKNKEI